MSFFIYIFHAGCPMDYYDFVGEDTNEEQKFFVGMYCNPNGSGLDTPLRYEKR